MEIRSLIASRGRALGPRDSPAQLHGSCSNTSNMSHTSINNETNINNINSNSNINNNSITQLAATSTSPRQPGPARDQTGLRGGA